MKRGKKKEGEIQNEICKHLTDIGVFFWRMNNVPIAYRDALGQMRFRSLPKYTPKGLPDLMCIHHGVPIALEVKRSGEYQKPEQIEMEMRITEAGGIYSVVRSVEDVDAVIIKANAEASAKS